MRWYEIPGWFDFQDVYSMASDLGGRVYVELGCWLGRSVKYLCRELRVRGGDWVVYGVDTWLGSREAAHEEYMKGHDIWEEFRENLREEMDAGELIVLRGDSVATAGRFGDGECDFVFIDASHEYEDTKANIVSWWPKVRSGGMMAGHDVNWPGVNKAVLECFGPAEVRGTTWIARKR